MEQGLSYIKGKTNIPLQTLTIGSLIEDSANKYHNSVLISSREQQKNLTGSEFLEEINSFAAALYNIGLERGDKIGIVVNNSIEAFIVNVACIQGGFIAVNLNPALQARELEYLLKTIEISCIICVDKYKVFNILDTLKTIVPEIEDFDRKIIATKHLPSLKSVIVISDTQYKGTSSYEAIRSLGKKISKDILINNQKKISCHDTFAILFTSGSTGNPKIVGISHYQLTNGLFFIKQRLPLFQNEEKFCFNLPLFHILGLGFGIISLFNGVTIVLPSLYYNPEKNLEAISEETCNYIIGTPTMLGDLVRLQKDLNLPLSSPYMVFCGGAAGSEELYKDILNVLKVQQFKMGYGISETVAIAWPMVEDFNDFKSVGTLMDHLEAKVVDSDGNIVPIGIVGELHVKGYSVIKNYLYKDTKAQDKDGWFKTGDAVYLDNKKKLYITGRLKDIINRGGEKVSPGEVEETLAGHPDILEAHVIGAYHDRLGEEVCACLKLKPDSNLSLDDVKSICKGKLSYYKIPSKIVIMDNFPKTQLGKIQKSKLVELINNKR